MGGNAGYGYLSYMRTHNMATKGETFAHYKKIIKDAAPEAPAPVVQKKEEPAVIRKEEPTAKKKDEPLPPMKQGAVEYVLRWHDIYPSPNPVSVADLSGKPLKHETVSYSAGDIEQAFIKLVIDGKAIQYGTKQIKFL